MRILVAHPGPQFSVHDVYTGWVEALEELGNHVIGFNLHDRLILYDNAYFHVEEGRFRKALNPDQAIELAVNGLAATLYKTHPDVLLCVSAFLIPAELLDLARAYGTKVVLMQTESPYEDDRQVKLAEHADVNLINDPTNLALFEAVTPTAYMPQAYRPSLHKPGPARPELVCDLAFVGTGFDSRAAFFEAMDLDGLDFALAGNWGHLPPGSPLRQRIAHEEKECLDNSQAVEIYQSARCGINLYRREGEMGDKSVEHRGWAMGPREVEMAACGLFFLRDPRPEGDDVLGMLPRFESPEEASDLLRFWLARDERRAEVARQARAATADRTFTANAVSMLQLLEGNNRAQNCG